MIGLDDLPSEVKQTGPATPVPLAPGPRPTTVAESLYRQIVEGQQSFWSAVYGPFMARDLTREDLRTLVGLGLQQTSGSYRTLIELFNMPPADYKRFLNFLRKHQCHMPFQQFRTGLRADAPPAAGSRLAASA